MEKVVLNVSPEARDAADAQGVHLQRGARSDRCRQHQPHRRCEHRKRNKHIHGPNALLALTDYILIIYIYMLHFI